MVTHAKDARLFVVQRNGVILIYDTAGVKIDTFMNIRNLITTSSGAGEERGLLSIAFSPNYASNGYFFVYYNDINGQVTISRWSVSSNPNKADMSSETIVIKIFHPFSNHNGGCLRFDQFGYLVAGTGDGGSAGDPGNRAQNIDSLLGKMLRFDVTTLPYTIPPGYFFVGAPGRDEIRYYGMRNPWRFSFNRLNGDLWIGDVGQNAIEEINKVANPFPNTGLNFGWKCYEGSATYNTSGCPALSTMTQPVAEYTHTATGGCSITGGYFYTGTTYPNFQNKYFFADFCTAQLGTLNSTNTITWGQSLTGYINSFGEDSYGELYVAVANDYAIVTPSIIYKVIDSSLSTSEFDKAGFSLCPNPAKTEVFIKNNSEKILSSVSVFEMTGKLVLTKALENNPINTLPIASLAKGLYLVSITDETGNQFQSKLIVQ
jgi:glucose/arabinose dehydrogenase